MSKHRRSVAWSDSARNNWLAATPLFINCGVDGFRDKVVGAATYFVRAPAGIVGDAANG